MVQKTLIRRLEKLEKSLAQLSVNSFIEKNRTNKLFRPKDITILYPDVTTRQITDLAERKIVKPAVETSGEGVPRLYDMKGVFDIIVSSSLRGILKPADVKKFIKKYRDEKDCATVKINRCVSISLDIKELIDIVGKKTKGEA